MKAFNMNNWNLNLVSGDRISVFIPTLGTFEGIFLSMTGNVLVWIADLPGAPVGLAINHTFLENGNIAKL